MDNRSIKENILRLREERGMTQEYVADSIGISLNAYWGIEKGKTSLISQRIYQLASIFNVSVSEIVFGYDAERETIDKMLLDTGKRYETEMTLATKDLLDEIESLKNQLRDKETQLADKDKIIKLLEASR